MKSSSVINQQISNLAKVIIDLTSQGNVIGGTLNFDAQTVQFDKGYFVSRKAPSIILSLEKFKELTIDQISELLKKLYFKATASDYLGFWVDDQKIYIDLSCHILNRSQAINFGLSQDQLAIWDCYYSQSINLSKYSF